MDDVKDQLGHPFDAAHAIRRLASYVAHASNCSAPANVACSCDANQSLGLARRLLKANDLPIKTIEFRLAHPMKVAP
jgi:hypothetical protein